MLTLTPRALGILTKTLNRRDLGENAGVRISAAGTNGDGTTYRLMFVEHPAPDDVVLDNDGTRIFVAAEVVEPLNTAIIDTDESEGKKLVVRHAR